MKNQRNDIRTVRRIIGHCQRHEGLTGLLGGFCLPMVSGHALVARSSYFDVVMKELGKTPKKSLPEYQKEVAGNQILKECYMAAIQSGKIPNKYKAYEDRFLKNEANVVHYYAIIREMEPEVVVETGTAAGSWTSVVLAALEKNGKGKLISIDLPAQKGKLTMDTEVTADEVGYLIPKAFRSRWELKAGDAKILLPDVLAEHAVDIFIHDSLHTRTHMLFEYNVARALMKPDGVILSDDILWNDAFFSFAKSQHLKSFGCVSNPNLGFVVNRFDDYEKSVGLGIVR